MNRTTLGGAICLAAFLAAGYASADSSLGQLPGGGSAIADVPAAKAVRVKAAVKDPIAAAEQTCLNGAMSTMAMQLCLKQTSIKWDARLNAAYGGLMKALAPEAAASLRAAQRVWLTYRDANSTFLAENYDPAQMGSEGKLTMMDIGNQIVRERALTLKNQLSLYDGSDAGAIDGEVLPIDAELNACMDQEPSTAGMVNCIGKASGKYEAEMAELDAALKGATKAPEALETARQAWLAFRAAEHTAIGGVYGGLQGTMYVPMAANSKMEVVRQRVLVLKAIRSL